MFYPIEYYRHKKDCRFKQTERAQRIASLPAGYHTAFNAVDKEVIDKPIQELVQDVHKGVVQPIDILRTYGKVAVKAHARTNCVTEVMLKEAEGWTTDGSVDMKGPLAGIPVSLKDSIVVGGFDTTVGYSSFIGNKTDKDGPMVRLLKDAGAVPYVKTNLPITLLSFESTNDVWGRSSNPWNTRYSPGGSTGGEAALLACGGRIGVGSDVAGSVRAPAHFSGIYSLRCSTGRWPKMGICTSMPGQEGIPSVYSPMTRTLNDLSYFTKSVVGMQPWKYDHSVHPIPWREDVAEKMASKEVLNVGVLRTDGVVDPSPACARALNQVVEALKKAGHQVSDITPPAAAQPREALTIASILLNADGCKTFSSFYRAGEWEDAGAKQMRFMMNLPRPIKWLYWAWVKYVRRDELWAELIGSWSEKSAYEQWKLVAKREAYKARWHEWWEAQGSDKFDFLITPPNATPAVPHDGMKNAVASCGYTFMFNLLDYTCGILPVTHVDRNLDALPATFSTKGLNGVAKGAYMYYDADAMHDLPVAVQVVGQRLEEEKVLAAMKRIEDLLDEGVEGRYRLLDLDTLD